MKSIFHMKSSVVTQDKNVHVRVGSMAQDVGDGV